MFSQVTLPRNYSKWNPSDCIAVQGVLIYSNRFKCAPLFTKLTFIMFFKDIQQGSAKRK